MICTISTCMRWTVLGVIVRVVSDSNHIYWILFFIVFTLRGVGCVLSAMLRNIFSLKCFYIYCDAFSTKLPCLPLDCFCDLLPPSRSIESYNISKSIIMKCQIFLLFSRSNLFRWNWFAGACLRVSVVSRSSRSLFCVFSLPHFGSSVLKPNLRIKGGKNVLLNFSIHKFQYNNKIIHAQ